MHQGSAKFRVEKKNIYIYIYSQGRDSEGAADSWENEKKKKLFFLFQRNLKKEKKKKTRDQF